MGGRVWARRQRPARMRASYRRLKGTEHFLGFYDVHADCLSGVFRKRKGLVELHEAFRWLRACYPRKRLFVIMDNLHNVHDHPRFRTLLRRLHITPVPTPTEASWLNLIEAQFGVLKRFTVAHTDDPTHAVRRRRVYRYLHYRHRKLGRLGHPLNRIRSLRPVKLDHRSARIGGYSDEKTAQGKLVLPRFRCAPDSLRDAGRGISSGEGSVGGALQRTWQRDRFSHGAGGGPGRQRLCHRAVGGARYVR